jgi:hypothetical protein
MLSIFDPATFKTRPATHQLKMLKRQARRACCALHKFAKVFPIGQPRAYLWQGTFEWLSGRPYVARELWQKSLTAAEHLAMPYAQGLAHYELGRHLPPGAPARAGHLSQARDIFTQLGAAYDLEQVHMELSRFDN